jgi:excisionase family DNA binding protein
MKLLNVDEVASVFGVRRWRIYDLARAGLIPAVRVGRQLRFSEDALRDWIGSGGRALEDSSVAAEEAVQ